MKRKAIFVFKKNYVCYNKTSAEKKVYDSIQEIFRIVLKSYISTRSEINLKSSKRHSELFLDFCNVESESFLRKKKTILIDITAVFVRFLYLFHGHFRSFVTLHFSV